MFPSWSPGGSIAHFAVTYMSHFGHLQKIHHVSLPGREDMDVRMLGSGRPFVLEIANARARLPPPECFDQMAASLNASGVGVEVRKLQPVDRDTLKLIKVRLLILTMRSS